MSVFEDQKKFMLAGGQTVDKLNEEQLDLYDDLINEEDLEFNNSCYLSANEIKEAVDKLVVTIGWLFSRGVDPQKAWDIVHENNMFKVSEAVKYDENGKIMKSEGSKQRKAEMMNKLKKLIG